MENDQSILADTEVHYLRSVAVGDEYKIFIGHCGDGAADSAVPVLYLTDANGYFGAAVDAVRSLQLMRHLPALLVVGIGYRAGGLAETVPLRTRDLTPTIDPAFAEQVPAQAAMGGAPRFLDFLRWELQPWVAQRFRVDPHDRAYFGHSFGGLFGVHVMLTAPETFGRYIIGSPSLWWHNEICFQTEAAYAAAHDDLPVTAFFGIGADETHEGRQREAALLPAAERAQADLRYLDMVEDLRRFLETLRGRRFPHLQIESAVFPDEFHITVPQLNLTRGLRSVFDAPT